MVVINHSRSAVRARVAVEGIDVEGAVQHKEEQRLNYEVSHTNQTTSLLRTLDLADPPLGIPGQPLWRRLRINPEIVPVSCDTLELSSDHPLLVTDVLGKVRVQTSEVPGCDPSSPEGELVEPIPAVAHCPDQEEHPEHDHAENLDAHDPVREDVASLADPPQPVSQHECQNGRGADLGNGVPAHLEEQDREEHPHLVVKPDVEVLEAGVEEARNGVSAVGRSVRHFGLLQPCAH